MTSRREEKERRRRERLEAERRESEGARRRLLLGYVGAGVLVAVIVAGIVVAVLGGGDGQQVESGDVPEEAHVDLESGSVPSNAEFDDREGSELPTLAQADLDEAAKGAGCEVELGLPDEGATHLGPGEEPPKYDTTPPTSGNHHPVPAADGAYLSEIPPERFLHSLEHGRVAILYDPTLPEEDQLELKGLFDEDPVGMLLFPYSDMPYAVTAVSWTNKLSCDSFSAEAIDALRDFRDQTRGQGPEPVPL